MSLLDKDEIMEEKADFADGIEAEVQRALRERPSFSIRTKITAGFLLWFLLSLGITLASLITLNTIEKKLVFLESASNYTFEIQQARRFEKNFFLYHTNLQDALEHVKNAERILEDNSENINMVIGREKYLNMAKHLARYEELLNSLAKLDKRNNVAAGPEYAAVEAELREHGAQMVAVAQELLTKERQAVNTLLRMVQRIPLAFLFVLLLLMIYLANFLARQMLKPLNRLMDATRNVAEGNFTLITPSRKFRDEFTDLALALNHMMHQLEHRQRLLVQAHKLKAIGTLTAGVAHELNNPINNIMLTSAMLLEDYNALSDNERLDMAKDLLEQAERAQKIIRNLLDFARESEIQMEQLNVHALLDETIQLVSNQLKLSKIKVERVYMSNPPPIYGDRQQLSQVFLNMFLNAVDAMPKGGTLKVKTYEAEEDNFIKIEISDTGVGIPEHVLPNIFDPFFTTKPTKKGTGLGLSVSLGIIRKHGGNITVKSQVNKGTSFFIILPAAKIPVKV